MPFWPFALQQGERDWGPVWKNNTTQIWSVYLHPNMVKKKSLTLKLRFFLLSVVYPRLYDSAASSASPLGSAASLAINPYSAG